MSTSIDLLRRVWDAISDFTWDPFGLHPDLHRIPGEPIAREVENENRLACESARLEKPA
jgi:hypothetical protein